MSGAASISNSSSASAAARLDTQFRYGDIIIAGKKPTPPWLWLALGALLLTGAAVWLVRR